MISFYFPDSEVKFGIIDQFLSEVCEDIAIIRALMYTS